jgi:hypothetical protein
MTTSGAKRPLTKYPILQVYMVPLTDAAAAGSRSPSGAALQALLAGATLSVKSGGKDRANGHAGR